MGESVNHEGKGLRTYSTRKRKVRDTREGRTSGGEEERGTKRGRSLWREKRRKKYDAGGGLLKSAFWKEKGKARLTSVYGVLYGEKIGLEVRG